MLNEVLHSFISFYFSICKLRILVLKPFNHEYSAQQKTTEGLIEFDTFACHEASFVLPNFICVPLVAMIPGSFPGTVCWNPKTQKMLSG